MGNQIRDHHARSIFDHLTKEPPRLMSNADSELPAVTIYTDGACSPNPGPGGWGAVVLAEDRPPRELSGYGGETTNNRMELTGVIEALAALERPSRIDLYTDSQYVKNGITSWIESWRRRNWRTADNRPVKNVDLWQRLLAEIERHRINWHWVRGHAANRWNERADALAVMARKDGVEQLPTALEAGRALQSPPPGVDGLAIYTGVTCKHSSGLGAWAVIMIWRGHVKIMGERVQGRTANQLYLRAVTTALSRLTRNLPVTVFTHSGYLKDGAVSWLPGWRQRNWQTREGTPVSNRELWQELDRLLRQHQIAFQLEDKERPLCLLQEAKELAREFEQEESR